MATVTVDQGKLVGGEVITDNNTVYYEFLGVPYAKPPIGNLRFKSPQPPEPWTDERDATAVNENKVSMQTDFDGKAVGNEDCLYLNVYTPKLPTTNTKLLPVMFFIHGGGFYCSNGIIKSDLGPDYLIEDEVVVVTINYRLGVLGFLSLDIPEASGNMGLKDQVQALKWVQNNIQQFGGDKNNITIFGISAGSASVEYLMLSPLSRGLFHKAIMQSGSSLNHWAINFEPKTFLKLFLKEVGYTGSIDNATEVHAYLMEIDVSLVLETCLRMINNTTSNKLGFGFVPTIEKDFGNGDAFITENPFKLLKEGNFTKVPVIKGFCEKEGYLTAIMKPKAITDLVESRNFLRYLSYKVDEDKFSPAFSDAYPEATAEDEEKDKVGVDFFGDLDFIAGIYVGGEVLADNGVPVYLYELCYDGNINFCKNLFGLTRKGAAHGDDIAYVFKHAISKHAKDEDVAVRSNMTKMWTYFAKNGAPTEDDSDWPGFSKATPAYLSIDKELTIKTDYAPTRMAIFEQLYETYGK